jgi:hypothetical protein
MKCAARPFPLVDLIHYSISLTLRCVGKRRPARSNVIAQFPTATGVMS